MYALRDWLTDMEIACCTSAQPPQCAYADQWTKFAKTE